MKKPFQKYATILLDLSIDQPLDYGIPEHLIGQVDRGVRVEVPVKGFKRSGYVLSIKDQCEYKNIKAIDSVVPNAKIDGELFQLAVWMAKYYCTPLRQVLKIVVPGTIRKKTQPKEQLYVMRNQTREELQQLCIEIRNRSPLQAAVLDQMLKVTKGILLTELLELTQAPRSSIDALVKKEALKVDIVRVDRSPFENEEYFKTKAKKLNDEQQGVLNKICHSLDAKKYETHLLYGVTGSGKTEVYLQAIEHALRLGRGVIMLIPEISLTAQTIERFRSRFEGIIAILHHRLSDGERLDQWDKICSGEARIVIGARSAIFSPIKHLGLIIVDEEHEPSYKQTDEMPCYHARDVAVMRAKLSDLSVILGSATPSLESYYNAQTGKYTLGILKSRADAASLPTVTIVNMEQEYKKAQGFTNFSEVLIDGIKTRIRRGEQAILFLNRRGYHTTLFCQHCKKAVECQHCDVSLTYHQSDNSLACHLCGFTVIPPPKQCPHCRQQDLMKFRGVGTELIEKSLYALLPEVRILRMDADTTRHKGSHERLLRAFGTGKADVLIGTQMIAKGLHFPQVTLVGVLNSDSSLNIPDFRASEQVFQVITQVSGRAGRGSLAGEVIIQTLMPENSTIQLASRQDYEQFYRQEIEIRQLFGYPPYQQMVKLAFSGEEQHQVQSLAEEMRQTLIQELPPSYEIYPVVPAGHAKVKDQYRFQFIIRGGAILPINKALERAFVKSDKVKIRIDVNPLSVFF